MKYDYIIVTASEREDRGQCHIGFPSMTFQSPEERGNKPPKCRFINKKKDSLNDLLFFFEFWTASSRSTEYLISTFVLSYSLF